MVPALLLAAVSPILAATPPPARHVCPDGLEVVVSEMHATALVTIELGVRAGAMTEDDRTRGASHLYEHLFFEGKAARLRALGVEWSGSTTDERVSYFFTGTSDHFADQMALVRDAATAPAFDDKALERERAVVADEIDHEEREPSVALSHAIESRVFQKPSRPSAPGKPPRALATTIDMLRTIQRRYYVPGNSVLVVTGDVKADDVFAMADRLYAGWAAADDPFKKFPVPDPPPIASSQVVLVAQPVEGLVASIVWSGPSTIGPTATDTFALDLLAQLVADPGSRFQRTLVESGACQSAGLWYAARRRAGEVGVDLDAAPDRVDACVAAVMVELPKLEASDYFSDDELVGAAHRIEIGRALERETTTGRAHALTAAWGSASLDYDARLESAARSVARPALAAALDHWVVGKPFVLGAMASLKAIDAGLTEGRLGRLVGIPASSPASPATGARPAGRP